MVHKRNPRVQKALKSKKKIELFAKFRREGIELFNRTEAKKKFPSYQGERKRRKYQKLVFCSVCICFVSKRFFSRHKKYCQKKNDVEVVEPRSLDNFKLPDDLKVSDKFVDTILSKLISDEVATVIKNDSQIIFIGNKLYKKLSHKKEKLVTLRNQVRNEMRMLATLYINTKSLDGFKETHNNVLDLFDRDNFDHLSDAVENITKYEDQKMKAGQRKNYYYLLRRTGKKFRDRLYQMRDDALSNEVNSFLRVLKSNQDILLNKALYNLEKTKQKKSRKPCQFPKEEDINSLFKYIKTKLKLLCSSFTFYSTSIFIEIRNLAMTRLTLLNARRGGETGRLLIEEWREAEEGSWIDKQRLKNLTEAEKMLIDSMKICYFTGKGNHHIVPMIIPEDCMKALKILTDPSIRNVCGIMAINEFVFASTKNSDVNFSGWHALKAVCEKLKLQRPDLINATNNRHRVSTLYAALEIPESERNLFYSHMGHTKEQNVNTYQAPLAVLGITKVGKNLMEFANGE